MKEIDKVLAEFKSKNYGTALKYLEILLIKILDQNKKSF